MDVVRPDAEGVPPTEGRPLPELDNVSSVYWGAAAEGRLLIQECPSCGHRQFYPRALCTACGADTDWKESSGRGTVHTYTVIHQNWAPPFGEDLPYVVAMVELAEGPRMMANITHCAPEELSVGLDVVAYAVEIEDGLALPMWRPARD